MSAIEYGDPEATDVHVRVATLIRQRRGGALTNLDRMLLHSPPFAEGFNFLLPRVRNDLSISALDRELTICAVAAITGAKYELHHHTRPFKEAGGTPEQLAALADMARAKDDLTLFDLKQRAILNFVSESTQQIEVRPSTLGQLRSLCRDDRYVMEILAVAACYNMVARIVTGLSIAIED